MEQEKSAGAVIFYLDKEPKFLLLKYKNYWGFMKGNIEKNETIEETIKRETQEETGIKEMKITPGFRFEQKWFYRLKGKLRNKHAVYFLIEITKQQAEKVKISDEHEDFIFLGIKEALKKMKIKNNKEMLQSAYDFIKENSKQKKLF